MKRSIRSFRKTSKNCWGKTEIKTFGIPNCHGCQLESHITYCSLHCFPVPKKKWIEHTGIYVCVRQRNGTVFFEFRQVVYKGRSLSANFQIFFATSIQVRLFSSAYMQCSESVKPAKSRLAHVRWKRKTCNCYKLVLNVNQPAFEKQFACDKQRNYSCMHNNGLLFSNDDPYLNAAYVPLEFGESAACIWMRLNCNQVRLLYATLR